MYSATIPIKKIPIKKSPPAPSSILSHPSHRAGEAVQDVQKGQEESERGA